jgi:hypothetical protein
LTSSSTLTIDQSFGSFSPRGACSKGDQQPDGRVAHSQKLQNILGVDIRILATQALRARKARKWLELIFGMENEPQICINHRERALAVKETDDANRYFSVCWRQTVESEYTTTVAVAWKAGRRLSHSPNLTSREAIARRAPLSIAYTPM